MVKIRQICIAYLIQVWLKFEKVVIIVEWSLYALPFVCCLWCWLSFCCFAWCGYSVMELGIVVFSKLASTQNGWLIFHSVECQMVNIELVILKNASNGLRFSEIEKWPNPNQSWIFVKQHLKQLAAITFT